MKEITVVNTVATLYIPAPCRGVVVGLDVIFNTDTVQPNDTVDLQRDSTSVCLLTVATSIAGVKESGVRDATNKALVFDPDDAIAANQMIKVVTGGAPGSATLTILFDDSAYIEQPSVEA
jgi:hypothetical protein